MKNIVLDGQIIENRSDLYEELNSQLAHAEFQVKNLDALSDLLGELESDKLSLTIEHADLLLQALGSHYYYKFLQVFDDQKIEIMMHKMA